MKQTNIKEFDLAYQSFLTERDIATHKKAVETLLDSAGLKKLYKEFLSEPQGVRNFFLGWEQAGEEEADPREQADMRKMGILSRKLYERHDYQGLVELFFNVVFRHFADHMKLEERKDFEKITDQDLYELGLIPDEIFMQFFLMETLVKTKTFDWKRGEEIANKNLACFIVCFGDVYEFFHEEDGEQVTAKEND